MQDYLKNTVEVGDTVIIAMKSGRTVSLSRGFVKDSAFRPQYNGGLPTNMLLIEWSNLYNYWMPASKVVRIPPEMLPEKRKERLNEVQEAVQP